MPLKMCFVRRSFLAISLLPGYQEVSHPLPSHEHLVSLIAQVRSAISKNPLCTVSMQLRVRLV